MLSFGTIWTRGSFIGIAIALASTSGPSAAQKMYKHVDEKGNVSFSDRPQKAEQKAEKTAKPNVASREATRQLEIDAANSRREEYAERAAAQRRAAALAQKEYAERERQRRAEEEAHPDRGPRPIRIVR